MRITKEVSERLTREAREAQVAVAAFAYVKAARLCESLGIAVVDWSSEGPKISEIEIKDFRGPLGGERRILSFK